MQTVFRNFTVPIHIGGFFAKFTISAVCLLRQRLFFAKKNGGRANVPHSTSWDYG
jgi:hypothetical protein